MRRLASNLTQNGIGHTTHIRCGSPQRTRAAGVAVVIALSQRYSTARGQRRQGERGGRKTRGTLCVAHGNSDLDGFGRFVCPAAAIDNNDEPEPIDNNNNEEPRARRQRQRRRTLSCRQRQRRRVLSPSTATASSLTTTTTGSSTPLSRRTWRHLNSRFSRGEPRLNS